MNGHTSPEIDSSTGYPYGKPYAYGVLSLLSLLYAFDFMDRMILSSLFSDLNREMGITEVQFGLLTGIMNLAIALLAFPASLLIDRWSRKKTVALMEMVWAVACLSCAFTTAFWQLLVLRFMVGAGEAGYGPGANTIVQSIFPVHKRNSALGILQSASPIGVVLGMIVGGMVAQRLGWRHAFGIVAIPGMIAAVLVLVFVKEPPRAAVTKLNKETGQQESVPLTQILKKIFSTPSVVLTFFGMAMALCFYAVVGIWIPSFFRYSEGLGQEFAGYKSAGVMLAGAVGVICSGFVADRLTRIKPSLPLKYASLCMALTFCSFQLALQVVPFELRYPCLLAGAFFLSAVLGICYNVILQATHPGTRATALGCLILMQNIFGMALGAGLSGFVAKIFNARYQQTQEFITLAASNAEAAHNAAMAYGLGHTIQFMSIATLVACVLFFLASLHFKSDCEGAECFD